MKVKQITKEVSKTKQFEQYEPFSASCTMTADIEEGDDPREVGNTLYTLAKHQVNKDILKRAAELDCDGDLHKRILGEEDDDE